ncbi:Uncharacterised protein [Escherichia coli]|uniref:Uncharacterized protein n=1 Tax=Escherichia coli TaxID=562 RepID=A0A376UG42_ECOLX|nr:Uncharacterised protein [Escherichia coli]
MVLNISLRSFFSRFWVFFTDAWQFRQLRGGIRDAQHNAAQLAALTHVNGS